MPEDEDAVAQWISIWFVGGSRPACAQVFFKTPPENSSGAENSAEISGTNGINFFCYMYESSLRHPVWVPEINVKACNSVMQFQSPQFRGLLSHSSSYT
jgi:hypothetical protein